VLVNGASEGWMTEDLLRLSAALDVTKQVELAPVHNQV
jgi:hypothetical protein